MNARDLHNRIVATPRAHGYMGPLEPWNQLGHEEGLSSAMCGYSDVPNCGLASLAAQMLCLRCSKLASETARPGRNPGPEIRLARRRRNSSRAQPSKL